MSKPSAAAKDQGHVPYKSDPQREARIRHYHETGQMLPPTTDEEERLIAEDESYDPLAHHPSRDKLEDWKLDRGTKVRGRALVQLAREGKLRVEQGRTYDDAVEGVSPEVQRDIGYEGPYSDHEIDPESEPVDHGHAA